MDSLVKVRRGIFTANSTGGSFLDPDGDFVCYTLEPSVNPLPGKPKAMPLITCELVMQWSTKFQRDTPHMVSRDANGNIIDVAGGHSYTEIHPGNFEGSVNPGTGLVEYDSLDCLLVGLTRDVDYVGQSRDAFNFKVMPLLDSLFKNGRVFIQYEGGPNV
jgi:hypothetical protein